MAKHWSALLVPAEEKRVSPAISTPSFSKRGRVKKTWDILFIEYSRLFRSNLIIIAAFIPFIAYIFTVFLKVTAAEATFDYALNTGIGYPYASVDNAGKLAELIAEIRAQSVFAFLLSLIPGPLFAGSFDVAKLLMWENTDFKVMPVFFKGVKKHWWKYAVIYAVFCALLYGAAVLGLTLYGNAVADGGAVDVYGWIGFGALTLVILTYFIFMQYAFSMMTAYELKFTDVLKNGALYTAGIYPLNFLFAAVSLAPIMLVLTGNALVIFIAAAAFVLLLLSVYTLIWTSFAQYGFESFLNKIYAVYLAETAKLGKNAGSGGSGKDGKSARSGGGKNGGNGKSGRNSPNAGGGVSEDAEKKPKKPVKVNVYKNPKKKKSVKKT
ncbi:MAG: hypothetical protein LBP79_00385 [Clostridiales bacterium]|jgi:uncharacterized membrane protein YesL|nr:hypothetical protein [Clostridiales bacterium]